MTSDEEPDERLERSITEAALEIFRRGAGRRPIARTHVSGDVVAILLQETMTRGEMTLSERGLSQEVRAYQGALQRAMRPDFEAAVELLTGRRVRAFMSTTHIDPDYALELLVLAPDGDHPTTSIEAPGADPIIWEGRAASGTPGTPPARRPLL